MKAKIDSYIENNIAYGKMTVAEQIEYIVEQRHTNFLSPVSFQSPSWDTYLDKYALKTEDGQLVDKTIFHTLARTAVDLASAEPEPAKHLLYAVQFFNLLVEKGCVPAGRILSNAGALSYKSAASLINCTVSRTIRDSMKDILDSVSLAGQTLKANCGIGYEFSTIRPQGAFVAGAGADTNGPLAFMDVFDKMCSTVMAAGGRRGAQMGTFDVRHPNIREFIQAKREAGRLRNFNLSVLITEDFMKAKKNNTTYALSFPIRIGRLASNFLYDEISSETEEVYEQLVQKRLAVWRDFPVDENYIRNSKGEYLCKVFETVEANDIWDLIMESNYKFAEPGFILIDKYNDMNNNWYVEDIRATNPCGEQGLPPDGSCLLGQINLVSFVKNPFTSEAYFDVDAYKTTVYQYSRMLDNVVERANLPLLAQTHEIEYKRRHGMGYLGLGSALAMLCLEYGSDLSAEFTERVTKILAVEGFRAGADLAKEKGAAPVMSDTFVITNELVFKNANLRRQVESGVRTIGEIVTGRDLFVLSEYFDLWQNDDYAAPVLALLSKHGSRYTHATSIAPTGTIAFSVGNNCSNGIEPSFMHHYTRNRIMKGRNTKEALDVFSYELLLYRKLVNPDAMPDDADFPLFMRTTENITPDEHIKIQAAAQKWIDSSISKTCNVPMDFDFGEFQGIYLKAYDAGLKGFTTYRPNPEGLGGVLVRKDETSNTVYEFTLEDGTKVKAKGDDMIDYNGEEVSAANLHDAIREGLYGKL
jgi:ribonucleoside-diphosphate reductase alpha chain